MAKPQAVRSMDDDTVCEMNTTPLIDVMLVLLIMFILSVPMQTHATRMQLPDAPPHSLITQAPVIHQLDIDFAGITRWNGAVVSDAVLDRHFQQIGQIADLSGQPEVHFRPDKFAKYQGVLNVLAMAQKRHVSKINFVGNEAYAVGN